MSESFVSYSECKDCSFTHETREQKESYGGLVFWKSDECLTEISSYGPEVNEINFTALTRKSTVQEVSLGMVVRL